MVDIHGDLPCLGTRKLHFLLVPQLGEYASRIGRDYLLTLLASQGLLIRRRKWRVVTTQTCPTRQRLPNLIAQLRVNQAEQVWGSGITYVCLLSG